MTTLLIAAICFVAGVITGVVALLAFAFWATRGLEEIAREFREARKPSDDQQEGAPP
jgi:hypothetical protein